MRIVCALAATLSLGIPRLVFAADQGAEAIEIPLKEVWAFDMPGTRDVRDLEGQNSAQPLASGISAVLHLRPEKEAKGFAIVGEGREALTQAHAILTEKQAASNSLPTNSEVTLVFFSRSFNYYVHLHSVERQADVITIKYVFVPHKTKELTAHFALIPMGQLPAGKWQVKIVQSPMEQKHKDAGFKPVAKKLAAQIVSGSFTFEVVSPDGINRGN